MKNTKARLCGECNKSFIPAPTRQWACSPLCAIKMAREFDEWWDANAEGYLADSLHMSEYHMASVVWLAAMGAAT